MTDVASAKLVEIIGQQGEAVYGLRVHVFPGGCSGYSYGMSLAGTREDGDWEGEFGGVKVLIDPQSKVLLEGAKIDYMETVQASGFTITNPNAARSCGCGKSFQTEEGSAEAEHSHSHGGGCGCGSGGCGCGSQ
jgi:iron-sulfur cluster assembly accessory protein